MHITCLIYHLLQPQAALFWDVCASFLFFLVIINREPDGVVSISANEKRLQNQVYRQVKSKLMNTFGSGKIYCLKDLNCSYIVSYLHFLNLNDILIVPKLSPPLKLSLIWHSLCLLCFLSARFMREHTSLRSQNKCRPSIDL